MKLRTLPKPALALIAVVLLLAASGASYAIYQAIHGTPKSHTRAKPQVAPATATSPAAKPAPTPEASTYTPGVPCQSAQLNLALAKNLKSNMNHTGAYFSFTNISGVTCTLNGYPTFEAKTTAGQIIYPGLKHEGGYMINDPGAQTVTLDPGASAFFGVSWSTISNDGTTKGCIDVAKVFSTPPGGASALTAAVTNMAICSQGFSITAVAVREAFTTTTP